MMNEPEKIEVELPFDLHNKLQAMALRCGLSAEEMAIELLKQSFELTH